MTNRPGCEGCKFLMREDYGYSNWTVEGTTVTCLKGVNPQLPSEDFSLEGPLKYGETCPVRAEGDPVWFDVDGEVSVEDACGGDAEVIALVKEYRA